MVKKQKHEEKSAHTCIVVGPMDFSLSILAPYIGNEFIRLIYIDGGFRHRKDLAKLYPKQNIGAISFGDGDSSQEIMNNHKIDQNISDLGYFLKSEGTKSLASTYLFLGFLGGRLDHMLFNLGELTGFMKGVSMGLDLLVMMDDQIQILCSGIHLLCIEGPFSIGGISENKIKINGDCEYTTPSWITLPPLSSRGLSNYGRGHVIIETEHPLFIIYN